MIRQTSFSSGEVDISIWKRTDVEQYLTAAQSLLNCEVGTTGLARKRKGSLFRYNVTGEAELNSTMYEFLDKNGVYYLVMASSGYFYIWSAPLTQQDVITYQDQYVVTYTNTQVVTFVNQLTFIQAVPMPYSGADLFDLDYTQDNDSIIFTSPLFPPGRLFISNYDPLTFSFEYLDIYPLPAYDFNLINYNGCNVLYTISTNIMTFQLSNIPAGSVFTNQWVGGQIVGAGATDTAPIGYAIITAVSQTGTTATFTATVIINFLTSGYSTSGAQYSIRSVAFTAGAGGTGNPYGLGYPSKVLYFQNRLWLANTALLQNTIFGSKLNQPISFDVGTGADTDAIIYTIGQTNAGPIYWMNGGKQLEVFTVNFEFACPQNEDIGLTPSTFSIRQQSSYGTSSLLKPQTYLNDTYIVQRTGKAMINYHFTGVGLSYQSTNIAPQSSHLMKNPTNRALLRGTDTSQDNFIYLLNDVDNTITAFQFANEIHLAALTPIVFQNNVQLIDIVSVNNQIYVLKYYVLTNQFIIEELQTGVFVDCAFNTTMDSLGNVVDLDIFNGYMVQVIYQGQDYGEYLVVNGEITVNNIEVNAGAVTVGLLFNVEIRPMYPYFSANTSPFEKQVYRIYVDYYESLNFMINGILVQYQDFKEIQLGLPLLPRTDTAIVSRVAGYNRFDEDIIVITQSSPFDLQILAIGYQVEMAVI